MAAKKQYGNPLGFVVTLLMILFAYLSLGADFGGAWNAIFGVIAILLLLLRLEMAISGRGVVRLP